MNKTSIFIIIINYHSYSTLLHTISCVFKSKHSNAFKYTVVVVDQEYVQSKLSRIEEEYPQCIFLKTRENLGVGAAFNKGIDYSIANSSDYVLLLTSDIYLTEDTLEKLYNRMKKNKSIGIASPTLLYKTNPPRILFAGGKLDSLVHSTVHFFNGEENNSQGNTIRETHILNCPVLISKEVIKSVGRWREEYFMYYEDIDYYTRTRKKGYLLCYMPDAIAYTDIPTEGDSPSFFRKEYYLLRNLLLFNKYNYSVIQQFIAYSYVLKNSMNLIVDLLDVKKRTKSKYQLMGIADFLLNRTGMRTYSFYKKT